MIDFHTHILPGIDDGSGSIETTRRMLQEELLQGVTTIVATPHFYPTLTTMERFMVKREKAWNATLPIAQELGIRLIKGAEVAYFRGIASAEGIEKLTFEGTNILLLEMPMSPWNRIQMNEVKQLCDAGYQVIFAHIERYYQYRHKEDAKKIMHELPIIYQSNAGAFMHGFNSHKVMKNLLEGRIHLLGSDCHNMHLRAPNLKEGREIIAKKIGQNVLDRVDDFGDSLLRQY